MKKLMIVAAVLSTMIFGNVYAKGGFVKEVHHMGKFMAIKTVDHKKVFIPFTVDITTGDVLEFRKMSNREKRLYEKMFDMNITSPFISYHPWEQDIKNLNEVECLKWAGWNTKKHHFIYFRWQGKKLLTKYEKDEKPYEEGTRGNYTFKTFVFGKEEFKGPKAKITARKIVSLLFSQESSYIWAEGEKEGEHELKYDKRDWGKISQLFH